MAKTAIDAKREDMFKVDPEGVHLVVDKGHALYDPRVHLPLQENLVLNIKTHGVKEPILVRKNGDVIEVVDGRQRVKHAREANRRLVAEGCAPMLVRAVLERGDDATVAGIMVLTNENRTDDNPVQKAEKARRLIYDYGKSETEAAVIFGCTRQTIRMYLSLLDLCSAVRASVERGELSSTAASKLARLHHDEQREMLETMRAQGGSMTVERAAKASRGENAPPAKRMRKRAKVAECLEANVRDDEYGKGFSAALRWVLCEDEVE